MMSFLSQPPSEGCPSFSIFSPLGVLPTHRIFPRRRRSLHFPFKAVLIPTLWEDSPQKSVPPDTPPVWYRFGPSLFHFPPLTPISYGEFPKRFSTRASWSSPITDSIMLFPSRLDFDLCGHGPLYSDILNSNTTPFLPGKRSFPYSKGNFIRGHFCARLLIAHFPHSPPEDVLRRYTVKPSLRPEPQTVTGRLLSFATATRMPGPRITPKHPRPPPASLSQVRTPPPHTSPNGRPPPPTKLSRERASFSFESLLRHLIVAPCAKDGSAPPGG